MIQPTGSKVLTIWPFVEKVGQLLLYAPLCNVFILHLADPVRRELRGSDFSLHLGLPQMD